jgi:hypothetical protein
MDKWLVYLDGDAFLANSLDESVTTNDYDVGVTLRPEQEIQAAAARGDTHILNAGVIFFNTNAEVIDNFVNRWVELIEEIDGELREQTALTELIRSSGEDIFYDYYRTGALNLGNHRITCKIFPCERYNYYNVEEGIDRENNRILHLKSGRHKDEFERIQEQLRVN